VAWFPPPCNRQKLGLLAGTSPRWLLFRGISWRKVTAPRVISLGFTLFKSSRSLGILHTFVLSLIFYFKGLKARFLADLPFFFFFLLSSSAAVPINGPSSFYKEKY